MEIKTLRGADWQVFSRAVLDHIENYTCQQYGDKGNDIATEYTVEQCLQQVKKYLARQGRNQRQGQDQMDLLKAAHYLQLAWSLSYE